MKQASTGRLCLFLALLLAALLPAEAKLYVKAANGPDVDTYRSMVFAQTEDRIKRLNELEGQYFTSAHNQFSHLTPEEFAATYLGGEMSPPGSVSRKHVGDSPAQDRKNLGTEGETSEGIQMKILVNEEEIINSVLPATFSIDYSTAENLLETGVKDQGACGSCWAFAGIAEIESYFLAKHKLWLDLSEQQMVDCLPAVQSGNAGCGGGFLDSVGYYSTLYPIAQEKYYPYTANQDPCDSGKITAGQTFNINSYGYIRNCLTLADTLLKTRPIGICGRIDYRWQSYKEGVVPACDPSNSGHCVLLVGVASDETTNKETNYWKIRNSWGSNWGENGYMKLFRDKSDNSNGICKFCTSAIYSI